MALTCPNCGKKLPDDAKFCGECGTTVVIQEKKPDYCVNCFAELPTGVKFCLQCGKPAVVTLPKFPLPEHDKAIYEELETTSPEQVKRRKALAIYEATGKYPTPDEEIEDFEKNRARIAVRARKWAEYETSGFERIHWFQEHYFILIITLRADDLFGIEQSWFPTNKPNHHKALFFEEYTKHFISILRQQGVLTWDDPPQIAPLFYDYMRKVREWTDEDLEELKFKPPDLDEIRGWATKDEET